MNSGCSTSRIIPKLNTTGVRGHQEVCYHGGWSRSTRRKPPCISTETDTSKRYLKIVLLDKVGSRDPQSTHSSLNSGIGFARCWKPYQLQPVIWSNYCPFISRWVVITFAIITQPLIVYAIELFLSRDIFVVRQFKDHTIKFVWMKRLPDTKVFFFI